MPFDLKTHLKTLVETHAPSGHEAPLRAVLREAWRDLTDTLDEDGLGSLIGVKKATRPLDPPRKLMLAAHMDEIGMLVREVVDGFIYVHPLGGIDARVLPAQPVLVHGKRTLPGVVATTPPHLLTPDMRGRYQTLQELVIDVALPHDEVTALVQPGDTVTPDAPLLELNGKRLAAKAFDDRACVAIVTYTLYLLSTMQHHWDVYAVATVQEETGLRGAATSAYRIQPDAAVALDVTFAPQAGVPSDASCEMGGGPALGIGPNFHLALNERLRDVARANEIKIQDDVIPGASGTDAWTIQVARTGVPTALLSVPLKNMHSPVEMLDLRDVERTARLLALCAAGLDGEFLRATPGA